MLYYEKKLSLRVSDYDLRDRLAPSAVLDLFQFVATEHAERIGIGYKAMLEKNLFWVLVRCRYDVVKNPEYCSEITVKTWPREEGRIDYDRDYEITDEKGDLLVYGSSKWCVVNAATRRIAVNGEVRYSDREFYGKAVYPDGLKKIKDFSTDGFSSEKGRTTYSDLDHNGHVNNANYGKFVLNALRPDAEIKSFGIDFINEMSADSDYEVFFGKDEGKTKVKGVSDGKQNFRAEIDFG